MYCIDDLCHSGSTMCGAGGPLHCRLGPPVVHDADQCDLCAEDDDGESWGDDDGWADE